MRYDTLQDITNLPVISRSMKLRWNPNEPSWVHLLSKSLAAYLIDANGRLVPM